MRCDGCTIFHRITISLYEQWEEGQSNDEEKSGEEELEEHEEGLEVKDEEGEEVVDELSWGDDEERWEGEVDECCDNPEYLICCYTCSRWTLPSTRCCDRRIIFWLACWICRTFFDVEIAYLCCDEPVSQQSSHYHILIRMLTCAN